MGTVAARGETRRPKASHRGENGLMFSEMASAWAQLKYMFQSPELSAYVRSPGISTTSGFLPPPPTPPPESRKSKVVDVLKVWPGSPTTPTRRGNVPPGTWNCPEKEATLLAADERGDEEDEGGPAMR